MVIEENKAGSRKSIASISKKSATLGAIVLGSAFAVSSLSANIDMPTVKASEGTTVTFASTNNAFLDSIIPDAYKLANDNDLYASVMIAQAILESNWGASGLSAAPYYNLFGIKGTYNGKGVTFYTLEDDGSGNYYQIRDSFRAYPSYKESLTDYANKMVNGVTWDSEFYSGTWKSNTSSYKDATAALTGTYATDTRYGGKLNNLITTHGLTQYDTPAGSTSGTSASVSGATTNLSAQGTTSSTNGGKSYTVKAGDGLYTVARALGVTVAEVKAQNGLTSNLIHPGQVLSVASSSASSSSSSSSTETATNTNSSSSSTSTSGKSYTVKSGDGLYSVAKALGISVSETRALNGGSDLIHPGQVFKAGQSTTSTSSSSSSSSASANTGSSSASTSGKSYTVKSGDGLYAVAKALGISVSEARSLNGGSDLIHPGQVFKAGQSTTSTSSSSSISSASENTGSSSASTSGKSYTVKSGDGLYTVARALGISLAEARALNGGSDLIHPGKVFTAGSSSQASSSQASSSSASSTSSASASQSSASTSTSVASASGNSYTVKSGDGLYTVARALGISLAEARALNGGSDLIHPGKVFTAGSSSQASSSQASSSSASSTSSASASQSSASTSTSVASASGNSYTVKSGDGIYTVARALGISLAEARALNGGSDLIHPGKVFTTGGSSQASSNASTSSSSQASTSSSTSATSSSATSSAKTHTVKSGETLYRIAKNNGLSLDELMTLNGLSNYNLYIGQVLKLN
ncbi:muramidase family protein [Aerococcus viridans]|uniref:muramidase family protein n=1 Tax=Aerococcus viridans TaxID=1377 RepID=UPI002DBEBCFA|nr:LysM peptidoglycan-binding domain-containing protein [Aerococcus viridans]MEC1386201.1 LysM peptidoglycan-binding domain-containing protein [Aerococcus viridans]